MHDTKVALITGAGNGIGHRLALRLADDGYAIAGIDVDGAGLQILSDQLLLGHIPAFARVADVTDAERLGKVVAEVESTLGPIELLVASAGVGAETPASDFRADVVREVIDVNLTGVVNSVAAVLPAMRRRRRGHVVGLSSVASFRGIPRLGAYSASKAGLNAILESLRCELFDSGIHVSTICPGWIRTNMTAPLHGKVSPMLELDDAVESIVYAIRAKLPFYAFPRGLVWKLRLLACFPRSWRDAYLGKMARRSLGS